MNIKPYIYIVTHNISKEFYIGCRTINKTSASDDLWVKYFTSSKRVLQRIKSEGTDSFTATVLDEFETGEDAFDAEQLMISERINNPLCLNQQFQLNGKRRFLSTGVKRPPASAETRRKLSESAKGKSGKYKRTPEHLAQLSANGKKTGGWNKGTTYKHTAPSPLKGRVSPYKGVRQPKLPCPHCERLIGYSQLPKHIRTYHN